MTIAKKDSRFLPNRATNLICCLEEISGEKTPVLTDHALVVDLEMSDSEYLELLAQGRDPVREQFYAEELITYGFTLLEAKKMAPLFEKKDCSIAEKILVNRALKRIWKTLTRS